MSSIIKAGLSGSGVNLPFFDAAAVVLKGEGGKSSTKVYADLLLPPVCGCSLVPEVGLPEVLDIAGLVDVRVSGRSTKPPAAEAGLERVLASAAAVTFM